MTPKEKKRNKTIYTGKLPTSKKKNRKSFWIFFLITTTSMESKLIKRKSKKISCSSFACWELSRVNSFISFGGREDKTIMKMSKWFSYA